MTNNGWRIMVVEDSFDDLQVIKTILEFNDVEVVHTSDDTECQNLLNNENFDAVVTDLAMPEIDGWDILRLVRENERTTDLPVIAMTAYHTSTLEHKAYEAGFDGYCPKPLNPRDFMSKLKEILDK